MNVNIIASGSKGNCAVIDDTLIIDAGWNCTPNGKYVLLTHFHTDHTKHLDKVGGLPIYCTQETADKLRDKFPYTAFNIIRPNVTFRLATNAVHKDVVDTDVDVFIDTEYFITPLSLKHDAPCVGFDITCVQQGIEIYRVFFATDFNEIESEATFVRNLREKKYDAVYIECNNTLAHDDFMDVFFPEEGKQPPRDEFHRRKSYQNHCNVNYLISLFERAGYNDENRFTEPITLLHKSSFYYHQNIERVADLVKIANVLNPFA